MSSSDARREPSREKPGAARELERAPRVARIEPAARASTRPRCTSAFHAALSRRRDRSGPCETTTRRTRRRACGSTRPARRGSRRRSDVSAHGAMVIRATRLDAIARARRRRRGPTLQSAPCPICRRPPTRTNAGERSMRWFTAFLSVVARAWPASRSTRSSRTTASAPRRAAAAPTRRRRPRQVHGTGAAGPEGDRSTRPAAKLIVGPARHGLRLGARSAPASARWRVRVDGTSYPARIGIARPDVAKAKAGHPRQRQRRLRVHGRLRHVFPRTAARRPASRSRSSPSRRTAASACSARAASSIRARSRAGAPSRRATRRRSTCCPRCRASTSAARSELDTIYAPYLSPTVARGLPRAHPLPAHDQGRGRRLRLRSRLGSQAQVRRAAHRRRFAQRRARALRRRRSCRCWSRSTAASGPTRIATCPQWDVNDKLEQDVAQLPVEREERGDARRLTSRTCRDRRRRRSSRARSRSTSTRTTCATTRSATCSRRAPLLAAFARDASRTCSSASTSTPTVPQSVLRANSSGTTTTRARCASSANGSPAPGRTRDARRRGVPDLRAYRRAQPLTLAEVNALAGNAAGGRGRKSIRRARSARDGRAAVLEGPVGARVGDLPPPPRAPALRRARAVARGSGHPARAASGRRRD